MEATSAEMLKSLDAALMTPLPQCWVCGGTAFAPTYFSTFELANFAKQDPELHRYTGTNYWLQQCRGCGFIQPEALPSLHDYFSRIYQQQWSGQWMEQEYRSSAKTYIFSNLLYCLEQKAGLGRLLDVGCHVGQFLKMASDSGWSAEGVELNPRTAEFAAHRTGLTVHQHSLESLIKDGERYDAVTLIDVLEHIPDPVSVLDEVRMMLNPGGWVLLKVPTGLPQIRKDALRRLLGSPAKTRIGTNLVHVNHFSAGSLDLALDKAGFVDRQLGVGPPELFPMPGKPIKRLLSKYTRLGTYALARIVPWGTRTPLALNLMAFGMAP